MIELQQDRPPAIARRIAPLIDEHRQVRYQVTDRLFAALMPMQWLAATAALWLSPRTWIGAQSQIRVPVWPALVLGEWIR